MVAHYCRDRFCCACGTARGLVIGDNLTKHVEGKNVRFITLTLRSFGDALDVTLNRLQDSFSRLREQFIWKTNVKGGAAFVEVKRGSGQGFWHVHMHLVVEGRYFDKRDLSAAWLQASGDSFIVDIRAVDDGAGLARYVCKYVSKPLDSSVFKDDGDLAECVLALHGRRLCNTFGSWRGLELEARPDDPGDWEEIGPVDAIIFEADCGDATCRALIEQFRGQQYCNERGYNDS